MALKLNGTNSVAAPAFTGDDTDTGLQCGTNELKLVTGGSARATVNSNGYLGVGTTSPTVLMELNSTEPYLQFTDSAAASGYSRIMGTHQGALIFSADETDSAGSSHLRFDVDGVEHVRLDSSGRLLIGNSTSSAPAESDDLQIGSTSNASHGLTINSSGGAYIIFGDAADSDVGGLVYSHVDNSLRINTNGAESMRVREDGVVLVGKTSVSHHTAGVELKDNGGSNGNVVVTNSNLCLRLNRTSTTGEVAQFMYAGSIKGRIQVTTTSTSYNTSSDYRLKENVVNLDGAIDRVKQLAPKRFNFIVEPGVTVDGFLAHEAQTVVPEAVDGTHNEVDDDGNAVMQGIDQSKLVPLLTAALQEAIAKIETLETKFAALEAAS